MGEWEVPGWCPPLAQLTHNSLEYIEEREKIETLSEEIKQLDKKSSSDDVSALVRELKTKRKNTSRALLERIWDSYSLPSFRKVKKRGEASDNSNNSDGSRRKLIELNIRKCYHGDESKLPCGCGVMLRRNCWRSARGKVEAGRDCRDMDGTEREERRRIARRRRVLRHVFGTMSTYFRSFIVDAEI